MEQGKIIEVHIDRAQVEVPESNILSLLGYGKGQADDHVLDSIHACLKESKKLITPRAGYIVLTVDELRLSEGLLFMGKQCYHIDKIIAAQLRKAKYVAVFISTIGKAVEKVSKTYMSKGDLLEGYIFDLIGSESAESVAGLVHEKIKTDMGKEGFAISNRFSPGYCNWSVAEQFKLFSFYEHNSFGINLNSSALMDPIKSVSAIVGIGTDITYQPYTCSWCSDLNCIYRNIKSRT